MKAEVLTKEKRDSMLDIVNEDGGSSVPVEWFYRLLATCDDFEEALRIAVEEQGTTTRERDAARLATEIYRDEHDAGKRLVWEDGI